MCGIFAYFPRNLGYKGTCLCNGKQKELVVQSALKIQHRGPDETHIIHGPDPSFPYHLIFHRLMINGLSPESGQPFVYPASTSGGERPELYLMCNGEIYNYQELIEEHDLLPEYHSSSDCEVILHLYRKFGIEKTLNLLDGVFALVLVDLAARQVYIARDRMGVRSLYYSADDAGVGVCSELKGLYGLCESSTINQFPLGCYGVLPASLDTLSIKRYYSLEETVGPCESQSGPMPDVHTPHLQPDAIEQETIDTICAKLSVLLKNAVIKRMLCDRQTHGGEPAIGAYLSGGFDSSVVAGLLADNFPGKLRTFSIGFKDSPDLLAARKVAAYIESDHYEYVVTEQQALEALAKMPGIIESPDATTNRASTFMWMLSKKIREISDLVVVLSGEGSDEASGSYMYFHNAPSKDAFQGESYRLLYDLIFFDYLRGDKCSAAAGLEIRAPFTDQKFLEYYMSIPVEYKLYHGIEKYILRLCVTEKYMTNKHGKALLPDEIIWRPKEAMSDGVSKHQRSWSQVIQEHVTGSSSSAQPDASTASKPRVHFGPDVCQHGGLAPVLSAAKKERAWFQRVFSTAYPGCEHTVPYDWLPKWCGDVEDASARVLSVYRTNDPEELAELAALAALAAPAISANV